MQCMKCNGHIVIKKGSLDRNDKILGSFSVENTEWEKCEQCGKTLYTPVTLRDIEAAEEKRKIELLSNRPIKDFILASEVADILGCTRQALHKHKRIRRGFIHFFKHNKAYQYLKESVEKYKETGDGRIPLSKQRNTEQACEGIIWLKDYHEDHMNKSCIPDANSGATCVETPDNPKEAYRKEFA